MQIINNWLKLPENYDREFWQYNAFNIQELANHNHDGDNGDRIPAGSRTMTKETFQTTDSEPVGFSHTLTFPMGVQFDTVQMQFFDPNGERAFLGYQKIDDDNVKVFSSRNDVVFEAFYG